MAPLVTPQTEKTDNTSAKGPLAQAVELAIEPAEELTKATLRDTGIHASLVGDQVSVQDQTPAHQGLLLREDFGWYFCLTCRVACSLSRYDLGTSR